MDPRVVFVLYTNSAFIQNIRTSNDPVDFKPVPTSNRQQAAGEADSKDKLLHVPSLPIPNVKSFAN